ncbi:unnamed protein product [Ilex paraguariensis]|uniref:BZIP domain-containing protein n=1 Tax=Ilex paraguariensis TaxID=185542 RepID=A0ABC8U9K1_9AQUA
MPQQPSEQPFDLNSVMRISHARSLSHTFESLPPLSPFCQPKPSSPSDLNLNDVSMEEVAGSSQHPHLSSSIPRTNVFWSSQSLPPRKGHRRANSDVPLEFSTVILSSPQLIPIIDKGFLGRSAHVGDNIENDKPIHLVKQELDIDKNVNSNAKRMNEKKSEEEATDNLFSAKMKLDKIDTLNSSGTMLNAGGSSDSEVESSAKENTSNTYGSGSNFSTSKREGVKRSVGGDIAPTGQHFRSVSMDNFIGKLHFGDDPPKLPPSLGNQVGQLLPSNSLNENSAKFSLEFGNGEFSEAELKKIMKDEKLGDIASSDPKRAKRILANRQSAARSKERKTQYISELEHKVQMLETEATALSTQLTVLKQDYSCLKSLNYELKHRFQAMEQQAQLREGIYIASKNRLVMEYGLVVETDDYIRTTSSYASSGFGVLDIENQLGLVWIGQASRSNLTTLASALHETLVAEVERLKLATAELGEEARPSNCMAQQLSMKHQMIHMQPLPTSSTTPKW